MADIKTTAAELAAARVRVYGKAQNHTALGIVNAYLVQYPYATKEDLDKAFPKSLNPDSGWPVNFKTLKEAQESENANNFFFTKEDEIINLKDGTQVVLCKMWTKTSFENLLFHAKQYAIVVAEFEAAEKGIGKKGGYSLEYLNGYVPPVRDEKKSSKWWLWLLLIVLAGALGVFGAKKFIKPEVQEVEVEKVVIKTDTVNITKIDTVYVQQVEKIQKEFNAAQFTQGKADLSDDAKEPLYKLADVLRKHENLKLRIVGHTSAEGTEKFNQALSTKRAKAAYDFLVARGIAADRMQYEGKGSSELINTENPKAEENRRTEFIIEENDNNNEKND